MKKLIRFIAIFTACMAITAITTSATTAQSVICSVANGIGNDGYTVAVTVSTKALCDGLQGELHYDSQKYSLVNNYSQSVKETEDGVLKLALVGDTASGESDWITFNFTCSTLADKENFSFENAKAVVHNATETTPVSTTTVLTGDANGDNKIDILDLVRVKKIAAKVSGVEVKPGSDCDLNGVYDANDLLLIKHFILGVVGMHFGK